MGRAITSSVGRISLVVTTIFLITSLVSGAKAYSFGDKVCFSVTPHVSNPENGQALYEVRIGQTFDITFGVFLWGTSHEVSINVSRIECKIYNSYPYDWNYTWENMIMYADMGTYTATAHYDNASVTGEIFAQISADYITNMDSVTRHDYVDIHVLTVVEETNYELRNELWFLNQSYVQLNNTYLNEKLAHDQDVDALQKNNNVLLMGLAAFAATTAFVGGACYRWMRRREE